MMDAIAMAGDAVIAVETDSITTSKPLPLLDVGDGLGQWELTIYPWITYLQSGVYFVPGADSVQIKIKSRGFDADSITHQKALEYLAGDWSESNLLASARRFIALGNPREQLYGQWLDEVRELSLSGGKRVHIKSECPACLAGKSASEVMHSLSANPTFGFEESKSYPLMWTDTPPNDPSLNADESAEDERMVTDWIEVNG